MNDNADGGIGSAPSSTAARSSLPASKDYPCPRLRQTQARYAVLALAASNTPCGSALLSVLFALRAKTHAPTHTKSGTLTSTPTRTGNNARTHTHTRTNAHSHAGPVGHSRMRRWVQRHRGDESKGYQRREHQSDDHRPAANAAQRSGLIQPPCDSFEWHQESGGFRWGGSR